MTDNSTTFNVVQKAIVWYSQRILNFADLALKSLAKWQRSALLVSTLAPPTPASEFSNMERYVLKKKQMQIQIQGVFLTGPTLKITSFFGK